MPADRRQTTGVAELVRQATTLLLLFAANYADLVAQLAAFFSQGVDMQSRRFGLLDQYKAPYAVSMYSGNRHTHPAKAVSFCPNSPICCGVTS